MLILTSADTITKCCTFGEVFTRSLPYNIGQIKPVVYSEFIQSSVRGYYNFGFIGREKFVVEQSGNELTAPIINFTLHSGNSSFDFVNNILQPYFYKNLSVGDTLTLKEYQILYRIK